MALAHSKSKAITSASRTRDILEDLAPRVEGETRGRGRRLLLDLLKRDLAVLHRRKIIARGPAVGIAFGATSAWPVLNASNAALASR